MLLAAMLALGAPKVTRQHLFDIQRSKNANVVRYDLSLDRAGRYRLRGPLDVYWVLLEEDGRREELRPLERRLAYGYKILPGATRDSLPVQLVAVKSRRITIRNRGEGFHPEVAVAGEPSVLTLVRVATKERGPIPKVLHVDLHGKSIETGRPTFERLIPDG